MSEPKMFVPQSLSDLEDLFASMCLRAPKFLDSTGYFPHRNLDWTFRQLNASLNYNQARLGEPLYADLKRMTAQMRALFEADPEDKTGQTAEGCKIILAMEDMLRQAQRR